VENIVIPSEEEHIKMYPMDFEEFLWAMGEEMLMPFVYACFEAKKEMGQMMHRKAMDYFRQYMIVGGMPQAVDKYVKTRNFSSVDKVKRQILELYRNDISKFAKGYDTKVKSIFEEIPSQLQKHEKKFRLSALKEGARSRDYETAFFWLDDAMIINTCYNTTEPSIGLNLNKETSTIKCYMADTGLLISHAFDENDIVSEELYRKIMLDKLEMNNGMIVENIVAQMLRTAGHKLYFYSNPSMSDKDSRMEIDFLIAKSKVTSRHNISPIEVKSSSRYTLTSLRKCLAKYANYLSTPYVIHAADWKVEDGITYLPLYMVPFYKPLKRFVPQLVMVLIVIVPH
jgi:predicted AAA+ superfamily ATPase